MPYLWHLILNLDKPSCMKHYAGNTADLSVRDERKFLLVSPRNQCCPCCHSVHWWDEELFSLFMTNIKTDFLWFGIKYKDCKTFLKSYTIWIASCKLYFLCVLLSTAQYSQPDFLRSPPVNHQTLDSLNDFHFPHNTIELWRREDHTWHLLSKCF